jgi:hypothetical protein
MAERAIAELPSDGVDWPSLVALGLTCLVDSTIGWMFATALVTLTTNGDGRLPTWFPLAILLTTALVPRTAFALESSAIPYETIVGLAAAISLAVSIKLVANPSAPWLSGEWIRKSLDSLVLKKSPVEVPVWVVVALVAAAWWRGRTRAEPGLETSFQLLRAGIPLTFLGATLLAIMEGGPGKQTVARAALVFLLSALSLIAFVRLTGLGTRRVRRIAPMDVAIAVSPLLAIAVVGIVVVALVTGDVLTTIFAAMHPIFWLLSLIVDVVLLILIVIIYVIVAPIFWLVGRGHFDFSSVHLTPTTLLQGPQTQQQQGTPHTIPGAIRYVIAATVLALIFAGVNKFIFQHRNKAERDPDEAERATERPPFDLGSLLSSLLGALRHRSNADDDPLAHLRGDPAWAATVRIRERYAQFLLWTAERNHPRRADQSPAELRRALDRGMRVPPARADLTDLTARYESARYSERPATAEDAAAVEAAWHRLRQEPIGPT